MGGTNRRRTEPHGRGPLAGEGHAVGFDAPSNSCNRNRNSDVRNFGGRYLAGFSAGKVPVTKTHAHLS